MTDKTGGSPAEGPTNPSTPETTEATAPLVTQPGLDMGGDKRYQFHFLATYATLGAVLLAAVAVFVIVVVQPGRKPPTPWSAWQPTAGSASKMTSQIADHVSHEYRLNQHGSQLVAVVPSKPTVTSGTTNIAIKAIAIRKAPQSNAGIEVLTSNKSEMYTFCGLGTHCSIASGTPTSLRGRLVRREALEVALYTFKFVPSIDSVIAFMPPAPNSSTSSLLFLRKENFTNELSQPLGQTLKLGQPPLPTQTDNVEANTIDQLTLSSIFSYELTALQTGGAALVLDPAT
jgi:hypothetical protein